MKKCLAILLAAILALGLTACGGTGKDNSTTSSDTTTTAAEPTTTTEAETTTTTEAPAAYTLEDGVFTLDQLRLTIPEGWVLSSDEGMYLFVPEDYPAHTDNLSIMVESKDPDFEGYTQADLEAMFALVYEDVAFIGFENTTKDGVGYIELAYTATIQDIPMVFMQYLYNADQLYTVTYTITGEDLMEAMEASSETIEILE